MYFHTSATTLVAGGDVEFDQSNKAAVYDNTNHHYNKMLDEMCVQCQNCARKNCLPFTLTYSYTTVAYQQMR